MTAVFPDKYLDVAVLKARNRPEGTLTRADLKGLRELKAVHIKALAGLEYAVNLIHLDLEMQLYDNPIKDISPLGSLTRLTKLGLSENRHGPLSSIKDMSPLGSLTNLTELDLRGNLLNDYAINRQIPAFKAKGIDVRM